MSNEEKRFIDGGFNPIRRPAHWHMHGRRRSRLIRPAITQTGGRFENNAFFKNWQAAAKASGVRNTQGPGGRSVQRLWLERTTNRTVEDTMRDIVDTGTKTRTGTRTAVSYTHLTLPTIYSV